MQTLLFLLPILGLIGQLSSDVSTKEPLQPFVEEKQSGHFLYLIHKGEVDKALRLYEEVYVKKSQKMDFSLLRDLSLAILESGINHPDREIQLLSLFGAGLSAHEKAFPLLERALHLPDPELQMIAIRFIGQYPYQSANQVLLDKMGSPLLPIRMEAAYALALKRHPKAVGQIESLMSKLPPFFKPFFPTLLCQIGTQEALSLLQQLLQDPYPSVRIATLEALLTHKRDDFLPAVRRRLVQSAYGEQEIGAMLLGVFKDSSSVKLLEHLSLSSDEHVRLSSLKSLYLLGDPLSQHQIEEMAKGLNLFAIQTLGDLSHSEPLLSSLILYPDFIVRINAALALLKKRDPKALKIIEEILVQDSRTLLFQFFFSPGRAHRCLKLAPASLDKEASAHQQAISFSIKELILQQASTLPEKEFLQLCQTLFDLNQTNFTPEIVALLEKIGSKEAISFLIQNGEKRGSPLIRAYCNLALFKLKQKGPYKERLYQWILENRSTDLIQLRTQLSSLEKIHPSTYLITERESSQLLIDIVQALVASQDPTFIPVLLEILKNGNPKNRYLFAGLLIRAVE